MGHNVDLTNMLGIETDINCPQCLNDAYQRFDDYDIDTGNCNPKPGLWMLNCFCDICEYGWKLKVRTHPISIAVRPEG